MRATVVSIGFLITMVSQVVSQPLSFGPERVTHADGSTGTLVVGKDADVLSYDLKDGGWANVAAPLKKVNEARPITFVFQTTKACTLELKFVDADGSVFGQRVPVEAGDGSRRVTIYPREAGYLWGGDRKRGEFKTFEIAVSGTSGQGTLTIKNAMVGKAGDASSFGLASVAGNAGTLKPASVADGIALVRVPYHGPLLDPDRALAGIGVRQRRAETLTPEDPLVLEWLKQMQDTSTPERKLITSTMDGDEVHTFNNVLAAMAFVRDGEQERAERILDFFRDAAVDRNNADPAKQSYYLRGEARGFYQRVSLKGGEGIAPMHAPRDVDRWMGDMAWLTLACLDHDGTFHDTRYAGLAKQLSDLLRSWFRPNPQGPGGYVQHGWRKGDTKLHEAGGHHEGNVIRCG